MISILIAVLALAIGIYVGSIVFGNDEPKEPKPDYNTPLVICMVFHKPPTRETLLNDCLKPRAIQIARHFGLSFIPVDKDLWKSIDKLSEQIMQWYNPAYNELVLVAHRPTPSSSVVLNWTWAVPYTEQ